MPPGDFAKGRVVDSQWSEPPNKPFLYRSPDEDQQVSEACFPEGSNVFAKRIGNRNWSIHNVARGTMGVRLIAARPPPARPVLHHGKSALIYEFVTRILQNAGIARDGGPRRVPEQETRIKVSCGHPVAAQSLIAPSGHFFYVSNGARQGRGLRVRAFTPPSRRSNATGSSLRAAT
jgi:hypothetical protein